MKSKALKNAQYFQNLEVDRREEMRRREEATEKGKSKKLGKGKNQETMRKGRGGWQIQLPWVEKE